VFHAKKGNDQDMTESVYWYSCKVPIIRVRI